jgi:microcin C transport system substrate-binding protein
VKAGNIDFFSENSAKDWATTYNVPALRQGWLVKERLEDHSSGSLQGYYMNTRRAKFQDKRLRRALAFAFDFKWTNEHIYYGTYLHPNSYFFGSELASSDLPSGQELEILEPYRDRLPAEIFNEVYTVPETDGSGWPRENLAHAFDLLAQAGWVVRDMKLVNADTGEQLSMEFMYQQQGLERAILPFMHNLRRLGIDVSLRLVDTSQYINRLRAFDFDMIVYGSAQSLSPGNEQRIWWGSAAADDPGSRNIAGIKDPVVDELIEQVIAAPDRETLVATTRALDRVLLWGHYAVPNLAAPFDRFVYWNKFGRPDKVPMLGTTFNAWWIDPAKERALAERRTLEPQSAQGESGLGTLALTGAVAALLLFGYLSVRRLRGGTAN